MSGVELRTGEPINDRPGNRPPTRGATFINELFRGGLDDDGPQARSGRKRRHRRKRKGGKR